jgi:hypothetical protein
MRSLTLAILAIATVSMAKSATAQTYAPSGRRHFVSRAPHYKFGPDCTYYTMWNWPFTC